MMRTTLVALIAMAHSWVGVCSPAAAKAFDNLDGLIAYVAVVDSRAQIFVANPDGTSRRQLTFEGGSGVPSWSPDGSRIAFVSVRGGSQQVWVMNADGSDATQLTEDAEGASSPDWSSDGSRIVYTKLLDSGKADLWVMNADGSQKQSLTTDPAVESYASWSPSGTAIVFGRKTFTIKPGGGPGVPPTVVENWELYQVNADGTGELRLTNNTWDDSVPAWRADGQSVLFNTDSSGTTDIAEYVDGSVQVRAGGPGEQYAPAPAPMSDAFAYMDDSSVRIADDAGTRTIIPGGSDPDWGRAKPRCLGHAATLWGTSGPDTLVGTAGRDVIVGLDGADTIRGMGGDDIVCGGTGNDSLLGGDGNDALDGGPGTDQLLGDAGSDLVSYAERTEPVVADIDGVSDDGGASDGPANARDRIHLSVEHLAGGAGNDRLFGNGGANTLLGGGGDDQLRGGGGNDVLRGGTGADVMYGEDGIDTVTYSERTTGVGVRLDSVSNDGGSSDGAATARDNVSRTVENIIGGTGNDYLVGYVGANRIAGGRGNDTLVGDAGPDVLVGEAGVDTFLGQAGNDALYAKDGVRDARIDGGAGRDGVSRDAGDPKPVNVP